ncbi:helix-turn-helix domain-containing protein [Patescibacteria group bacterium]
MKTVGEIFRKARNQQKLSIEDVEKAIKIRKRFIHAIESDDYSIIPSLPYAKGFVLNYAQFLGVDKKIILAFFRRQTQDTPRSKLLPKGVADPLNASFLRLTPGKFLGMLLIGFVCIFLIYFGLQYQSLQNAPILVIEQPIQGYTTNKDRIDILGKTDEDATVMINGVNVLVRGDGKFFEQIQLVDGINTIEIVATSRYGKTTFVSHEVMLQ